MSSLHAQSALLCLAGSALLNWLLGALHPRLPSLPGILTQKSERRRRHIFRPRSNAAVGTVNSSWTMSGWLSIVGTRGLGRNEVLSTCPNHLGCTRCDKAHPQRNPSLDRRLSALKSSVSVVLVIMELSQRVKLNKKACEHIAKRSAQLVQDIWRQTKDFGVVLPEEVERSVVDIENLFKEIESFFGGLETEKAWERFVRQDQHKSQVAEYGRLLDEAMMQFSINLELSIHRLHMEFVAADEKRHAAVLTVSQMSESERLQLLTQIRGKVPFVHVGMRPPVAPNK
ncbi:hypothetical protein B0H14DRAFT_3163439 [Mycena olivaceomarginata]|nr:hypothetical protein B0H14DRAFT_3163439 [Mycena olivaceomarginata]